MPYLPLSLGLPCGLSGAASDMVRGTGGCFAPLAGTLSLADVDVDQTGRLTEQQKAVVWAVTTVDSLTGPVRNISRSKAQCCDRVQVMKSRLQVLVSWQGRKIKLSHHIH